MRLPTFNELIRFVQVEGWEDKDKKSEKKKGNHHRYVFTTPTGERLYTRISHGKGRIYNPHLFQHILRDQLGIDGDQFWAAVDHGIKPVRQSPTAMQMSGSLDAKLVRNLITKVKVNPNQLMEMTQHEAISLWQDWLTTNIPKIENSE